MHDLGIAHALALSCHVVLIIINMSIVILIMKSLIIEVANYARSMQFKLRTSRPFFLVPLTFKRGPFVFKINGFFPTFFSRSF